MSPHAPQALTRPTEFHRLPKDNQGDTCNVCGLPVARITRGRSLHRRAGRFRWEVARTVWHDAAGDGLPEFAAKVVAKGNYSECQRGHTLTTARLFSDWAEGPKLSEITGELIDAFLVWYAATPSASTGKRPTASTVKRRRIILRSLIRKAAKAGKHPGLDRKGESTWAADELPPIPEEHHRWPIDYEGETCPVCGCPGEFLRNQSGHIPPMRFHRRFAEGAWETAYYGKAGWSAIRRVGRKVTTRKDVTERLDQLLQADLVSSQPTPDVRELTEVVRALLNREAGSGGNGGDSGVTSLANLPPEDRSLWKFYSERYQPKQLRNRSVHTVKLYEITLRKFAEYLKRTPTLDDLNDDTVNGFLAALVQNGLSPHTANKDRCNLIAIWRFACREPGLDGRPVLRSWPSVEPLIAPKNPPKAWTQEQLARLFKALKELTGSISGIPASQWWLALHCVLWDTGERIAAIMAAEWHWLDGCDGWLNIPAEARKGGREGKVYKLHPSTLAMLEEIRGVSTSLSIFPWPYHRAYIWHRYSIILREAGLPFDRKSKFHRMRKSVASFAEACGVNATELLGHSARKVTLDSYLDPRITKPKSASEILFRPDDPKQGKKEGAA